MSAGRKRAGDSDAQRAGNLLGAAALALAGALEEAIDTGEGRSESANSALAVMLQWPPRSIGHLAGVLRRSHSATVRLIEELEAQGLLAKTPGADRRAIVVRLTTAGRREAQRIIAARASMLEDVVGRLNLTDRHDLTRLLEKILPMLTPDRETCDHICRLCEISACPQDRCPVELAAQVGMA